MNRSLNVLSDAQGTVTFGFLEPTVYYLRISGYFSAKLGIDCGTRIREQFAHASAVTLYFDVAAEDGSAFAARSALLRALLAKRQQLGAMVMLVGSGLNATRARSMATTLGRPHDVIDSPGLFQTRLFEAAPSAKTQLGSASGTMRVARAVTPRRKSLRPRARTA